MMQIGLIAVGKLDRECWTDGAAIYVERLRKYCKFNINEIKEIVIDDVAKKIATESAQIRKVLMSQYSDYCKCLFSLSGKQLDSVAFSNFVENVKDFKNAKLVFVIGGSNGVDASLLSCFDLQLSLGKITLPHQLCRIVVLEQLYRAFKIMNNELYHK